MARKKLRIGFDFDGVIAYNPLRVFRRPAMWFYRSVLGNSNLHYPVPKAMHFRWAWAAVHETSFFPAKGFYELKQLLRENKIKAYIITGRYSFLDTSLLRWLQKHKAKDLFEDIYLNTDNEQPHLFKERVLKGLKLDYFVEDNWDIVRYLNSKSSGSKSKISGRAGSRSAKQPATEIHWIYNILDRNKEYKHKYPYLQKFLDEINKARP